MPEPRYIIIHGHFYQPPRESPWTGLISPEPGAAPFPNWNERILSECYIANARAHIMDGHVVHIRNNYAVAQLRLRPDADRLAGAPRRACLSRDPPGRSAEPAQAHGGHGNAIAQAYNHSILPLLRPRDREMQIAWGIEDFVDRFGRPPEGMWLPECAADDDTLRDAGARPESNSSSWRPSRARFSGRRGGAQRRRSLHVARGID